ncbi:VOC family protein [Peribacillus psychrosaccharolyticus]|uniref:VOC family protein n=1 Tax=Peribacillus psychrosaccharolyticus TaxID=1407 RepID=A0A974NNG7_PERPY|nr:VOC family protein [Peribacillus psychrosaccharolyticus]MEC2057214.1 VOC family protein [Peribacillus psychrosaccharolyticus]MED3742957.1 VOC family protein [Peribacillus psychrosaccharolyticus]QQT00978.1 VOC family protein [Peribacillus psychrosaccharolyticus]
MVPQRVSLITIGAFDLPALRLFYQQLGWAELDFSSDTYAVFNTAGVLLTLFPVSELADDAGVEIKQSAEIYNNVTLAINVETPELVDAAIAKIQEAGGKILRMPTEAFWGGRTSYFADPENNLWEVAWNPSSVFNDSGAMIKF